MGDFVLAMDGGGSKTQVAIADRQGRVEFSPIAAGISAFDNPAWRDNLAGLLVPLAGRAGTVAHAVFGMPGQSESVAIDGLYASALAELWPGPHSIRNDVVMAFDGAFLDKPGVLALAGTGSMTVSRGDAGTYARAGGWGDGFGDEGSAYWIGREALTRASWLADGRMEDADYLPAFTKALGLSAPEPFYGLLDWYAGLRHPRSEIARLAVIVDTLAQDGDRVATEILHDAAEHMRLQVLAAADRAGLPDDFSWSFAGSVFRSTLFSNVLADRLGSKPAPPALPPMGGGLWLAAQSAGWNPDDAWIDSLAQTFAIPEGLPS